MYVAKPYNFNLNPLFENERLDIHRDITFSTGAVQFLIKHGFDVGAVFTRGIRYLSHEEIDKVREQAVEKKNRAALIPDLIISPGDTEALNFYRNARQTIHDWSRKENVRMKTNLSYGQSSLCYRKEWISSTSESQVVVSMDISAAWSISWFAPSFHVVAASQKTMAILCKLRNWILSRRQW
jgi:hypothetical protein